jgi:RNA polymerase sigma-70 factor, ECF subfamily
MTLTEAELLARARAGDEDAFSELYRLHIGAVQAIGRGMLHRQDVEDVCQDTFLLAFTRLEGFAEKCTFRTWITRIAINECLAQLRARRLVDAGVELSSLPAVDAELEGVAGRLDLGRLLRLLPPAERQLVRMAHLHGVAPEELADQLGASVEYVRRKLYRARRRMQKNK